MIRRRVLAGGLSALSVALGGCLGGDSPSGDDDDGNTTARNETVDPDPGTPGTLVVELRATVVADAPEDATVVHSTDDRIARTELFAELFDIVDETASDSDEEIVGETFVADAPHEDRAGSAVLEVMKDLPETERSLDGTTRTGVHVEHESHVLLVDHDVVRIHLD